MPHSVDVGSEVGGYRITRLIGEGGMGAVYLAEDPQTAERVALKVLRDDLMVSDEFRRRFERESRYASSLEHPNIVRVHRVGETDGILYMVMDWVQGRDLHAELAERGPLDAERALAIVEQIASALDAAHETGVFHRDVKPANVILSAGGESTGPRCLLTDFGLSKNPTQDSRALTGTGLFVGTINYTAPEQIRADEIDHRVDVYSLGCLLYECLVAEPPFERPRDQEVLYAHLQDPPPKVSERRPDLPPELDAVIAKAMAKQPEERYSTCGEIVEAARAVVGGEPEAEKVADKLRIAVTAGNMEGTEIEVEEEFLFGRQLPGLGNLGGDPEISRRHARVFRGAEGFLVEDLGSTNGTFLNGRRISDPGRLSSGDQIRLGGTTLMVKAPAPAPQPEAATPAPQPEAPARPPAHEAPAPPPALSLRLRFDPGSGQVRLELEDGSDEVRLEYRDGRWRFAGTAR